MATVSGAQPPPSSVTLSTYRCATSLPAELQEKAKSSHQALTWPLSLLPLLCRAVFLLPGPRQCTRGWTSQLKAQVESLSSAAQRPLSVKLVNCLPCLLLSWKRFKWDTKKFEPHFSISPEEGYITAGMEVSFEVIYHPTEVGKEVLHKNLLCFIQGGNPLSLTLSGVCVGPPAVKEVSSCGPQRDPWRGWAQQAPQGNLIRPSRNKWLCSNGPWHPHQIFRSAPSHHRALAHAVPSADIFISPSSFS